MLLKRTCWFFNNALHTFKMWLYFLNSWHHNCEKSMKMYWRSSEKFRKCIEKFKCSCNLYVTKKVNDNLEITSLRSSLDFGNKIWIGKPFINIYPSRFFIFTTRKLWNYLVQVFLVWFSFFLLQHYTSLGSLFCWSLYHLQCSRDSTSFFTLSFIRYSEPGGTQIWE